MKEREICFATWLNVLLIKTQNAHVIGHMRSKLSSEHVEHMASWRVDILAVSCASSLQLWAQVRICKPLLGPPWNSTLQTSTLQNSFFCFA